MKIVEGLLVWLCLLLMALSYFTYDTDFKLSDIYLNWACMCVCGAYIVVKNRK